jgi:predicted PurR-regulated permease PerM
LSRLPAQRLRARRRTLQWLCVALFVGIVFALGMFLGDVFNPLLLGLLFAYILNPMVEALEAKGAPRQLAVGVIFSAAMFAVVGSFTFGTIKAAGHLSDLRARLVGERVLDPLDPDDEPLVEGFKDPSRADPSIHADLAIIVNANGELFIDRDRNGKRKIGLAEQITRYISAQLGDPFDLNLDMAKIARAYEEHAAKIVNVGVRLTQTMRRSLTGLGHFFSYLILVPVYTFFLALYFSSIRNAIRDHLPGLYREQIVSIAKKIDVQVAAFFRGKLAVCLLKGVVTWLGLWMAGVPFSFFIGMGAGLLSIVPVVGPLVGGVLAVVLVYTPEGWLLKLLFVALAFGAAEVAEAIGQPLILGEAVGLSPLTLILSLFLFGHVLGLFGVLLAVPIACICKTLFTELLLPPIKDLADDPGDDDPPPAVRQPEAPPSVPTFG